MKTCKCASCGAPYEMEDNWYGTIVCEDCDHFINPRLCDEERKNAMKQKLTDEQMDDLLELAHSATGCAMSDKRKCDNPVHDTQIEADGRCHICGAQNVDTKTRLQEQWENETGTDFDIEDAGIMYSYSCWLEDKNAEQATRIKELEVEREKNKRPDCKICLGRSMSDMTCHVCKWYWRTDNYKEAGK